jgi:hypothetical protein
VFGRDPEDELEPRDDEHTIASDNEGKHIVKHEDIELSNFPQIIKRIMKTVTMMMMIILTTAIIIQMRALKLKVTMMTIATTGIPDSIAETYKKIKRRPTC